MTHTPREAGAVWRWGDAVGYESRVTRGELIWTPADDAWSASAIGRLAATRGLTTIGEITDWSVDDIDGFWAAATEFCGMRWFDRPTAVRGGDTMPGVRWFPGGRLNYTDQALAAAASTPDALAVTAYSQTRDRVDLTGAELADAVARCAAGLRTLGVAEGDRVVAYAPNIPETLVAFLATASLGAVWSSCAPEFGVRSVVDRLAQIEPVVLVAVDGYGYGAKQIDRREHVAEIVSELPTLRHVVHVPYLFADEPLPTPTGDRKSVV